MRIYVSVLQHVQSVSTLHRRTRLISFGGNKPWTPEDIAMAVHVPNKRGYVSCMVIDSACQPSGLSWTIHRKSIHICISDTQIRSSCGKSILERFREVSHKNSNWELLYIRGDGYDHHRASPAMAEACVRSPPRCTLSTASLTHWSWDVLRSVR